MNLCTHCNFTGMSESIVNQLMRKNVKFVNEINDNL